MESQLCEQEDLIVVAAATPPDKQRFPVADGAESYMLVRSGQLADTMSRYLIQRIEENPAIELHFKTEITALEGRALERIIWRDKSSGETTRARHTPRVHHGRSIAANEWLRSCIALDDKRVHPDRARPG